MRGVDSLKKWTEEYDLFAVKSKKAKKTNSFVYFLQEATARQSAYGFIWPLMIITACENLFYSQVKVTHLKNPYFHADSESTVANHTQNWCSFQVRLQILWVTSDQNKLSNWIFSSRSLCGGMLLWVAHLVSLISCLIFRRCY